MKKPVITVEVSRALFSVEKYGFMARRRLRKAGVTCGRYRCNKPVVAKMVVRTPDAPAVSWLVCREHN